MPDVVYVDDSPETALPSLKAVLGDRLVPIHYDESDELRSIVANSSFRSARIVVSDFFLHAKEDGADYVISDGRAINDLSFAVSRGAAKGSVGQLRMILTAELSGVEDAVDDALSRDPFLRARQLNADWVGLKSAATEFAREVGVFLAALDLVAFRLKEGGDRPLTEVIAETLLPEAVAWKEAAFDDVAEAATDLFSSVDADKPAGVVRWLCHSVFPFPLVLLSSTHVAARLGVEPSWLEDNITRVHAEALGGYQGPLAELGQLRWWRAGFDAWLWRATNGSTSSREAIATALASIGCGDPQWLPFSDPVVVTDEIGTADGVESASRVARFVPRYWLGALGNSFAARDEVLRNAEIRRRLLPSELSRVGARNG